MRNSMAIDGYIGGSDPELKEIDKGSVCLFNVRVEGRAHDGVPRWIWYGVSCFSPLAERVVKFAKRGMFVHCEGKPDSDAYIGNDNKPHPVHYLTAKSVREVKRVLVDLGDDDAEAEAVASSK